MNHVKLNKQKLPVRFDMNALSEFEGLTGHSAFDLGRVKFGAKEIIALAFVGFKGADDDFSMTVKEVGKHLKMSSFESVMTAFSDDMKDILGEDDEGK